MRAAQRVGDERGLLAGARGNDDPYAAGRAARGGDQVAVAVPAATAGAAGGQLAEAARQPGGDPARGGQQHRSAPAAGAQGSYLRGLAVGGAEPVRESAQRVQVGPAERVDRLIRIADGDELPPVPGQLHEQLFLRRVGVLILVHEDRVVSVTLAGPDGTSPQQRPRDPDYLGVVVGRDGRQVEPGRVGIKEPAGCLPVVPVVQAAESRQRGAVQSALSRAQQEVAQLRGKAPGPDGTAQPRRPAVAAIGGLAPQQPAHLEQLLRAGQQDGGLLAGQHELAPHQGERVAVERHRQGLAQGAVQPERDPLAQFLSRLAAEGQDQHPARIDPPPDHAIDHRLHDRRRLAGTRSRQYEQRTACVLHDRALGSVKVGRGLRCGRLADEAVSGRRGFHLVMNSSRPH
jgi:hypothetical protein